jgi:hypothetical protein
MMREKKRRDGGAEFQKKNLVSFGQKPFFLRLDIKVK